MNTFKYTTGTPSEVLTSDSGLDLHCPKDFVVPGKGLSVKIDLGIKGAMYDPKGNNVGYLLVPRSSTGSKTSLRLSNSVGIIDSTYRGSLVAVVDNLNFNRVMVTQGQRLFQLVCFNGLPIRAVKVDALDGTERNEKGFGSSGV